jgi:hypothetical protein
MMVYENTSHPGYCTEKLMDAFLVGAIPIYWGDLRVSEDWNSRAFINVNELQDDWINSIVNLDINYKLFESMYNEPVFTEEQKQRHIYNIQNFEEWLIKIVIK